MCRKLKVRQCGRTLAAEAHKYMRKSGKDGEKQFWEENCNISWLLFGSIICTLRAAQYICLPHVGLRWVARCTLFCRLSFFRTHKVLCTIIYKRLTLSDNITWNFDYNRFCESTICSSHSYDTYIVKYKIAINLCETWY